MDITPEQSRRWPKSKALSDTLVVCHAVVYTTEAEAVAVTLCKDEQEADALAVEHQKKGHRAWLHGRGREPGSLFQLSINGITQVFVRVRQETGVPIASRKRDPVGAPAG